VPITGITLDQTTLNLTLGGADATLTVSYAPANASQTGITWSSSNTAVATVTNGVVHAAGAGTAVITAASTANNRITAGATVNVIIPVAGIALDQSSLNIITGGADITLGVSYAPANATQTGVTWSSSNAAVATVANGVVHAVSAGTAVITAVSAANSTVTAFCAVTVTAPPPGISLSPNPLTINGPGNIGAFTVVYNPPDAAQTGITWSSNNASVAAVNAATGVITAVAPGSAVITARSTANNTVTASATVNVLIPIAGIALNQTTLNLYKGDTNVLTVTYIPANTTQTGVTWSSSNPAVATVFNGTVTAVAEGTATITATSAVNTGISKTATVNVVIPVTGFTLDKATLSLNKGETGVLAVASYTPSDTTQRDVTWSSSNPAVAMVANGTVTAVSGGTAVITATSTADNTVTAYCTVNVTVPITGLSLPSAFTLGVGSDCLLTVTYTPPDTTQTGVTWSSSDPSVATVSNGTVAAKAAGSATITATSTANNSIVGSCALTVKETYNAAEVTIVFEGLEDETITLDTAVAPGNQLIITAPAGFDRYLWYMDGSFYGSTTMPTRSFSLGPGRHYISVIVEEGGHHFSKTLIYNTVGY
jgi:uncharacterized protein YjdB